MEFGLTAYLQHVLFVLEPSPWAKVLLVTGKGAHAKWTDNFPETLAKHKEAGKQDDRFVDFMV
jgi:hypothetical protein